MIPKQMEVYLHEKLPSKTWRNRLFHEGGYCFMEFGALDVDRLARLGIEVDNLGPHLVVCMWDESSPLEIGGYLVIDNLAMGHPAMGGIRMLPDITPATIHNLARGMTLKNAAAALPYGGGKAGIVSDTMKSHQERTDIIRGFARLLYRYHQFYLPGPDVGTNDEDMRLIAYENGLDNALSKPADMGGNRIDQLGAAAGGVIIALEALLEQIPRLSPLPQFSGIHVPDPANLTVLIQGFGAVGAHAARFLKERIPDARVIGISDVFGYIYDELGLPVDVLFDFWKNHGTVTLPYYKEFIEQVNHSPSRTKFSNAPDDLLRETSFCLIPAAPVANYLDTDPVTKPCLTVDRMGKWSLIIEGANTYSPEPSKRAARSRMERAVYRQFGVLIATDYLVNSGGVIYAAQEHLIKTPDRLRIPQNILGNDERINKWLCENSTELTELAEKRRKAAETYRDEVIRRNMHELVDLLISDADLLPCEAAETISVRRIATSESDRTASDIMVPIPTIRTTDTIRSAAEILINSDSPILAVLTDASALAGVVTNWDITNATATSASDELEIKKIMTRQVISAKPSDTLLELIRKLEHHEISAMPVVDQGLTLGMVSTDLLARRTLLRLLQSQVT